MTAAGICLGGCVWCDVELVWSCYVSCVAWAVGGRRSNCVGGSYIIYRYGWKVGMGSYK